MKKTLFAFIFFTACATRPGRAPQCHPALALVNATAWLQTSAEYRAIATQTYTVAREEKTYDPREWSQWVSESAATAVPGAAEFLAYARSRGVTPFYITNRLAAEEAATRRNLETLGYPLDANEDTILTRGERPEWSAGDKAPRRDYVASRYRVLLLFATT